MCVKTTNEKGGPAFEGNPGGFYRRVWRKEKDGNTLLYYNLKKIDTESKLSPWLLVNFF